MRRDGPAWGSGWELGVWCLGRRSCFSAYIPPAPTDQEGPWGPAPWAIFLTRPWGVGKWVGEGGRSTCFRNGALLYNLKRAKDLLNKKASAADSQGRL